MWGILCEFIHTSTFMLQSDVLVNLVSPDLELTTEVAKSFLRIGGNELQMVIILFLH